MPVFLDMLLYLEVDNYIIIFLISHGIVYIFRSYGTDIYVVFLMLYTAEKGKRKPEIYTLHKLYKQLLMKMK